MCATLLTELHLLICTGIDLEPTTILTCIMDDVLNYSGSYRHSSHTFMSWSTSSTVTCDNHTVVTSSTVTIICVTAPLVIIP